MKVDGKKLAQKYLESKTKDANVDAEGKDQQDYSEDSKDSHHVTYMRKFIEAVHSKEPHAAHAAIVEYAKGEPHRMDQEGRDEEEEEKGSKPSMQEQAKYFRKATFRE